MFKWYKLNFCRKITIWSRFDKDTKRYKHNHIEKGLQPRNIPQGHPSWKSGIWLKEYGWLDYKNRVYPDPKIYIPFSDDLPMIIFFILIVGLTSLFILLLELLLK